MSSVQLWVGDHSYLIEQAYMYAERLFGSDKKELIRSRQYYQIVWLGPEKNNYTRTELEPLFARVNFMLSEREQCCIIIDYADCLPPACANSLLKILEEPPRGYHFILLATRRELILPTIRSRCLITEYVQHGENSEAETFLGFFKNPVAGMQTQIMLELEKSKITEYQTQLLLDELFVYWQSCYRKAIQNNDEALVRKYDRLIKSAVYMQEMPPMPGSVKLFWKNLYLLVTL